MVRFSAKSTIIYGLCLFIIFQHIFFKYYLKNKQLANEQTLPVRIHIRKERMDMEHGPIIEPLRQDEEQNIENNQLVNIMEHKTTSEKLQTSSTTVTPKPPSIQRTILKAFAPTTLSINNTKHTNSSILKLPLRKH